MAKIRLTEKELKGIISESVKRILNEISPEMKARAMVKANHDLGQLGRSNDQVGQNLNGVPVHRDTQKRRRDRQTTAFRKGLENDLGRKFNKDVRFGINANSNDSNNMFSADYDDGTFRHYSDASGSERGSTFYPRQGRNVGHKDMRASEYLTNMVDGMAGYDSELKGHSPFDSEMNYVNDRADDVNSINRYNRDKEEYNRRKEAHDGRMRDYESLPWYKKPFSKKPLPFTDEEPVAPKTKTGPYFMPNEPESVYKRGEEIKANHNANTNAYNRYLKKK